MMHSILRNKTRKFLIVLFWIAVWKILSLIINRDIYLPSPFYVFKVLIELLKSKDTYLTIICSTYRTLAGFIISCTTGIILGYICGANNFFHDLFNPLIGVMRVVPVMSIIIIAIMWFSDTHVPIFAAFLMCFPIIWTNTVNGIKSADTKLLQMCKVYSIKKMRIIKSVYFYSAVPYIEAAMISALGIGWKVTSAAEVLSLPKYSIGGHLYDSKVYLEIPELFAWTVIIISLSYIFETILKKLFKSRNYDHSY